MLAAAIVIVLFILVAVLALMINPQESGLVG